mgnify:CR=1 FL=1
MVRKNRDSFSSLAFEFSDGPSKSRGGDLGFFQEGAMVKPFNDFEFEKNKGDLGVVKTIFGYHIIEILDQKNKDRAIKVATIARTIEPSEETINELFNTVQKFEIARNNCPILEM